MNDSIKNNNNARAVYIYWLRFGNGKGYVGSTVDICSRMSEYRTGKTKHQPAIYSAIKKYGMPISCILEITTERKRNKREGYWIDRMGTMAPWGYNLQGIANVVPTSDERRDRLSRAQYERWANTTPEQRSEIGRKRWASKTPAERSEWTRKSRTTQIANTTPEQRSEAARKQWASMPPEERRYRASKMQAKITTGQRSNTRRKVWASKTPEQRSEIGRKISDTRRANSTPEERTAHARKAAAARNANNPNHNIYPCSNNWRVRIYRNGKQVYRKGGIPTIEQARSIRDQAEAKIDNTAVMA